VIEQQISVFQ